MTGLAASWQCLQCDAHGTGPRSDRDAERHTKTAQHATRTTATPREDPT